MGLYPYGAPLGPTPWSSWRSYSSHCARYGTHTVDFMGLVLTLKVLVTLAVLVTRCALWVLVTGSVSRVVLIMGTVIEPP